jgi:hypothetical protein
VAYHAAVERCHRSVFTVYCGVQKRRSVAVFEHRGVEERRPHRSVYLAWGALSVCTSVAQRLRYESI